jgi:RNA polymerase sigma factor (sigma-70 family)
MGVDQTLELAVRRQLGRPKRGARLPAAVERELARRAQEGDEAAKRKIVEASLGLIRAIARTYRERGASFADLVQEGTLGLLRALEGYDPDRGVRLSTYADWWIRRAMLDAIGAARPIRMPAQAAHDLASIRRAEAELERSGVRNAASEVVATKTGLGAASVRALRAAPSVVASLDETSGDEARPLSEMVGDPAGVDSLEALDVAEGEVRVKSLLRLLPARHRRVVVERYGLEGGAPRSHREIGAALGVKEERSRQLEREALNRMRELAGADRLAA